MSSTTASSTSSLTMQSQHRTTPKDYESSFANLASQYGFGGSILPSIPRKSTKSTKPSSTSKSSSLQTSSKSSKSHPQKDYESSFGQLSSSYGFGGGYSLPTRH